jgi:hypothetical protein
MLQNARILHSALQTHFWGERTFSQCPRRSGGIGCPIKKFKGLRYRLQQPNAQIHLGMRPDKWTLQF